MFLEDRVLGFWTFLGFLSPCRGNLSCYFGVSLCFSLCYPKLGIPLTGRPCVFGGVLMFIFCAVLMSDPLLSDFVIFCWSSFVVCLILGHLPPSLAPILALAASSPPPVRLACRLRLFSRNHFQHLFEFWTLLSTFLVLWRTTTPPPGISMSK